MASAQPLTQDRIEVLRERLNTRFEKHPALQCAIVSILDALRDKWNTYQYISPDSFRDLNGTLAPWFDILETIPPEDAGYTVDQLCTAWSKLHPRLDWS